MNHYFLSHIQINKNHIKLYVCKNNLLIDNIGIVTKKNNSVKITIYDKKLNFWLNKNLKLIKYIFFTEVSILILLLLNY